MTLLLPTFIDITEAQQVQQLKEYFVELGASNLNTEVKSEWYADLKEVIPHLGLCFKDSISEQDLESICNSVISLILMFPIDVRTPVVEKFCSVLDGIANSGNMKHDSVKLTVLNLLLRGLPDTTKERFIVYKCLLRSAAKLGKINAVTTDAKQLREWCHLWKCSVEEQQMLWRLICDAYEMTGNKERSTASLIELLSTYTDHNASSAREDAIKCIVDTIMDENSYTMDYLLMLHPVKFLEGELIHNLLNIFVNGNLSDYLEFAAQNGDLLKNLKLNQDACMSKLRLLTLMKLGESRNELDYSLVREELHLDNDDELEEFIIEAVSRQAIRCRLDQCNRRILVLGTVSRTFGKAQWIAMQEVLNQWRLSVGKMQENIRILAEGNPPSH